MLLLVLWLSFCSINGQPLGETLQQRVVLASCLTDQKEKFEYSKRYSYTDTCPKFTCNQHNNSGGLSLKVHIDNTFLPRIRCQESDILHIVWDDTEDYTYFLELFLPKSVEFSDVTVCPFYDVENLLGNIHKIRLWSISNAHIYVSRDLNVDLVPNGFIPSPVQKIFLKELILRNNSYEGTVGWKLNKELSCRYEIVWINLETVQEARISVILDPPEVKLSNLRFDTKYTIRITPIPERHYPPGIPKAFSFRTPSCLVSHSSVLRCVPEKPLNLSLHEDLIDVKTVNDKPVPIYDVHLTWIKPKFVPQYYESILINNLLPNETATTPSLQISGNQTSAVFKNISLSQLYSVTLRACSPAGCSPKAVQKHHRADEATTILNNHELSDLSVALVALLLILIIVLLTALWFRKYRIRRQVQTEVYNCIHELEEKLKGSQENIYVSETEEADCWELDPHKLVFQTVLGEGAFGIVRKAALKSKSGQEKLVAVKMMKESFSSDDVKEFLQEIEIMKSVKEHPNIVSLIGYITTDAQKGPLLVVEYCERGDLQTYLRNAWEKLCNISNETLHRENYEDISNPSICFDNRIYNLHNINLCDDYIICPKHLLSFARQVALGMEHLAKTRVVHRDLAARNVLVCGDHSVKVSDFGLSRDVYQNNVYRKTGAGRLPVRWMALESLTHQRYTTQSDVWSFGVLLWEIFTLGGTPYVGIETLELMEFLRDGHRLKAPPGCSPELFSIMENCWKASPNRRPNFTEIRISLDFLLENDGKYLRLESIDDSKPVPV